MKLVKEIIAFRMNKSAWHPIERTKDRGFSLIEVLTVCMIIVVVMGFSAPVVKSLKGSGEFTRSIDQISGVLNMARAHAMTHNTYVWVGFYEEDASAFLPSESEPPYEGKGRVLVGMVASTDGTKIYEDSDPSALIPESRVYQLGKLTRLDNLHLADVSEFPESDSLFRLRGREDTAYSASEDGKARLSSKSADKTPFPFQVASYTFHKTIRFSPNGEASINGITEPMRVVEIGLVPTNGNVVPQQVVNIAAIQLTGIGGNIQIYRQ